MTFKVSSLRYGYANIFADSHIELVEMPVIPDGFSRATVGNKLNRPIAYVEGDATERDNWGPFPSEYGIKAYTVMQYQPNLGLTFFAWIKE